MNIPGLPPLPRIRQLSDGKRYVFPEAHGHLGGRTLEQQVLLALAGPFQDRWAAGQWIVEHLETKLSPQQTTLWAECLERAGGLHAEYGQLVYLLALILGDKPAPYIRRCAGADVRRVDRKLLASGEAA